MHHEGETSASPKIPTQGIQGQKKGKKHITTSTDRRKLFYKTQYLLTKQCSEAEQPRLPPGWVGPLTTAFIPATRWCPHTVGGVSVWAWQGCHLRTAKAVATAATEAVWPQSPQRLLSGFSQETFAGLHERPGMLQSVLSP